MEISGIEFVGSSTGLAGTIEQVFESRAEMVILQTGASHRVGIDLLRGIKLLQDPPVVVMVAPFMSDQYRRLCFGVGADYAFGIADESVDVHSLIDGLVRSMSVFA
jgi:DNA-binding NarL/FixJ family response regulator